MKQKESFMTSNKCHTQSGKTNIQSNFRILCDFITIAKGKKRRKKVTLGSHFYMTTRLRVMFSLSTLYFTTFDSSLTMQIKQQERNINVVLGWAGICGDWNEIQAPLNRPAWKATKTQTTGSTTYPDNWDNCVNSKGSYINITSD